MRDGELTWGPLDADRDRAAVAALAERCHAADGGMPEVTVSRFAADGAITTGGRTAVGELVAAAAVRRLDPGVAVIGLVDPAHRGRGVGGALLDWGLAAADAVASNRPAPRAPEATAVPDTAAPSGPGAAVALDRAAPSGPGAAVAPDPAAPSVPGAAVALDQLEAALASAKAAPSGPGPAATAEQAVRAEGGTAEQAVPAEGGTADGVTVETEALTEVAERLFASRGLRQVFAEDVMRFDLATTPPPAALPPGLALHEWTPDLAARFFAVYEASFRDRPGFPGWPAERWVAWTAGDEEFRPQWSLLAAGADGAGDAGFVTCAEGWIVQVGVVPAWRGRGVGGALVAEALRRMRAEGADQALLDVDVNNKAAHLYTRLGFTVLGRRAKFQPAPR